MSEQTPEQEIETLRAHNSELLADLKKAKGRIKEMEEQAETLTKERDDSQAELQRIVLDQPVQEMLEQVAVLPEHFMTEFTARGYKFEQDGNKVVVKDAEGKPAMVGDEKRTPQGLEYEMREAAFDADDIKKLVLEEWLPKEERTKHAQNFANLVSAARSSGGGARGSSTNHSPTPSVPRAPRLNTGLR